MSIKSLSAWSNSAVTGRILMKFDILIFFENLSRKFKFDLNLTRITVRYIKTYVCTFIIISRSVLLRMRTFSDKSYKKIKTYFIFSNAFPKIVPFIR
jgi:hypothetical protein